MSQINILVVEDEKDIREGIAELLKKDFQVFQAANGIEAIDIVKTDGHNIDAVLLDIILPDINGVEVLKKIKSLYNHLDVIMLTVLKDVQIAVNCLKEGAYDYLNKPIITEELMLAIKRIEEKEGLIRKFDYLQDQAEKRSMDYEKRKILLEELKMKKKLEGEDVSLSEYVKESLPDLENISWEKYEKELEKEIKFSPSFEDFRARILVVEDEKDIREGTLEILKKDYDASGAGSIKEALSSLNENKFDVILLDIVLPDGSGIDLLSKIKQISPSIQVIMVTVLKDVPTAVSAMKIGASDYVTKPFNVEDLLSTINRVAELPKIKANIEKMIEHMKKERLSQEAREKFFQELINKRKSENKKITLDDIYAFFPETRSKYADKNWEYPFETIDKTGIPGMLKMLKKQKEIEDLAEK